MAGFIVSLSGSQSGSATTGLDGAFQFLNLNGGSNLIVIASSAGYNVDPASRVFNDLGTDQTADFTAILAPKLLASSEQPTRALALESTVFLAEPFPLTNSLFTDHDDRTRITLFAADLGLLPGENFEAVTAEAEDASHLRYPLNVESVGAVPGLSA